MEPFIFLSKSNPFLSNGASSNRTRGLIEGIIEKGGQIDFYIFAPFFSYKEKEDFNILIQHLPTGLRLIQASNWVISSSMAQRLYSYIFSFLFEIVFLKKLNNVLHDFKGIVFTNPDLFLMKSLSKIKEKNSNIKLVCEVSEYLDYYKSQENPRWVLPKLIKTEAFFKNNFVFKLSACVVMTKALYKFFDELNIPSLKLLHLPMTVDLGRFTNCQSSSLGFKKPYILFVGVMNNAKDGVDILIDAFSQIAQYFPKYNLYLVGPWQYDTPGHLQKIKDYKLAERVFWINEVNRNEIPPLLLNSNLLVLPRPDSKQAQGGFPTKLGEYLASGKPVCATTVGEIPDYLTDNKTVFFAKPGSSSSFADAMKRALSSEEKSLEVGQKGKLVAEKFFNKDIQSGVLYEFLFNLSKQ